MPQERPNIGCGTAGTSQHRPEAWTETYSRDFLVLAGSAVHAREDQTQALLVLFPAQPDHGFVLVDCFWIRAGHAICRGYK